jgi:hypothetical protein
MASPTLLFNINDGVPSHNSTLCLRPSLFGSRPPTIPTARSVTIARVASPLSTDRNYQLLLLSALKRHFDGVAGARRLVKQGDVISIDVDTDDQRNFTSWLTEDGTTDVELATHRLVVSLYRTVMHSTVDLAQTSDLYPPSQRNDIFPRHEHRI